MLRVFLLAILCLPAAVGAQNRLRFSVTFPNERSAQALDGRLLLMLSADTTGEPRFQVNSGLRTGLLFGVDVDGWRPGQPQTIDAAAFGFPIRSLSQIPRGTYRVQALLNRYETFRRSDGHTVKLPPDKGEGQQWARKPGNLYSVPRMIDVDPSRADVIRLTLDQEIAPLPEFRETPYVKHVRIRSELLSKFWGRDMHLAAFVTLPWGFAEHPDARYPLVINHGHFASAPDNWRETPPDPNLAPDYSERFSLAGYNRIQQQASWQFYQDWIGKGFPRVLLVQIQHPTPFYDDSYAVNSANNGPYGDAIMRELIPEIERRYRGLGAGWARFTYGGSTGGWEAMAVQMFYPDEFNGAWVACPDPIDFRHYTVVNIYADTNAYYMPSRFKKTPRPGLRNYLGHVSATRARVRHQEPFRRSVGRVGIGVLAGRTGRVSEADLEQADRQHRRERCGALEGTLRPGAHPPARLEDAGSQAARQTAPLRRRHGQLLPEQRGVRGGEVSAQCGSAGGRGGGLRGSRRTLLERGPHAVQRLFATALPADGAAVGGGAHADHGSRRSGSPQLALLSGRAPNAR
jgi:hypothetical protein